MLFCSIVTFSVASMVGIGTSIQVEEPDWHMCQISNPKIVENGIVSDRTKDTSFCLHNRACYWLLPMTHPVDGFAACWRVAVGEKTTPEEEQKESSDNCYNRIREDNNFPYHVVYEQGDLIYFDNDHTDNDHSDIVPICESGFERQGESEAVAAAKAAAVLQESLYAEDEVAKAAIMVEYRKLVKEDAETKSRKSTKPRKNKNIKVKKAFTTSAIKTSKVKKK